MRVKKGRSVDTGTLDRALKDALPVLLRQPAFQRQQVVCRLLCLSKNIGQVIIAQCTGVLDVSLDAGRRHSFYHRDNMPPSQQFALWIRRHASLVKDLKISFETHDAGAKGEGDLAAALQHVQSTATAAAAAAAAAIGSSSTPAAAATSAAAAVAAAAREEAVAVAAAASKKAAAAAAAASAEAAAAAAAAASTAEAAAKAAAAAASTAEAAAKAAAVAQRQLSQATAAQQHLHKQPEQNSFILQSFTCSISGNNCPAVLQQLPANHLTRLELRIGGGRIARESIWDSTATAVARLTGLQTFVINTPFSSTLGDKLLAGALTHLTSLSSLSLSCVDYNLLCKLPKTLVALSLGRDSREICYASRGPVAAPPAIVLTHLTGLTRLQSNQLRDCEQLPVGLQDVSAHSCYNTKPLLGLTQLTGLSLGSAYRSYGNDEFDEYDRYDAYRDDFVHVRRQRGPAALFEAIPLEGLSELTSLTRLKELRLTYNRIDSAEADSSIWPKLPGLKSLHLRHEGHEEWEAIRLYKAVQVLGQLTDLTSLRFAAHANASMSELGSGLKQMTNLRELAVNNLWCVGLDSEGDSLEGLFEELVGLQNLRRLECNMPITGAAARALAHLTMLTSLDLTLARDNVSETACSEYADSDNSQCYLGPSMCQGLKDKYLRVIVKSLRGLKELVLTGNDKLTEAGMTKVQKYLPHLKLNFGPWPYCMTFVAVD